MEIGIGILCHKGKILIARRQEYRKQGALWEFPGGKLEINETIAECIQREFMEELGLSVHVGAFLQDIVYTYSDVGEIKLRAYWVTCDSPKVTCMTAHDKIEWILLKDIDQYKFCPANSPLIDNLKKYNIKDI